ncbi:hypothetical protein [Paraprevotella clara]|uniref:hypothetical protein n=1 Tax=Paraprevotella clara TaxID=454154 RepID=UPI002675BCC8|nr:hypothetical protein [Paraprevotella clara]
MDEFVQSAPNWYVTKKIRKTQHKWQKYSLILTYENFIVNEWKMLSWKVGRYNLSCNRQRVWGA